MNHSTPNENYKPGDRSSRVAVRQMLSAVDRMIAAAKQAERARNQLLGNREGRRRD
jgi:hypothetical protein